jgi:putative intracellular protease/amidase
MKVAVPLPHRDFDPTEVSVPWGILTGAGIEVIFATSDGAEASADPIMIHGRGLGPLKFSMRADRNGRAAYQRLTDTGLLSKPLRYSDLKVEAFDGLMLPGGHAPGMREYLESKELQEFVARFFASGKPVGAICHGVVLAARSGALKGRRTTSLPNWMEGLAWNLTRAWMGTYYRTYPESVQDEVTRLIGEPSLFERGPMGLGRDSAKRPDAGFFVRDGNYVSARWPGDSHRFGNEFLKLLQETR